MSRPRSENEKMPKKESSGGQEEREWGGTTLRDEQRATWSVRKEITISESRKSQSNRFLACCECHGKFHPACHSSRPLFTFTPSLNPSSLTHATRCRHARARTDRGWIARTTDAVFIMKPQYVDVIFPRARTCGSPSRSRSYFFLPPGTLSIFSFTKSLALGICHPKRSRMRCPG